MTDAKKKLQNEILPDPTLLAGEGTARQRTVDRMTRLLAIAAATATIQSNCGGESSGGYGVVDPMPPPARCSGIAATIKGTATKKAQAVEITLSKPGRADAQYDESTAPRVDGGAVSSVTHKDGALTMVVSRSPDAGSPPPGAPAEPPLYVTVAVQCSAGPAHLRVEVNALKVNVSDDY